MNQYTFYDVFDMSNKIHVFESNYFNALNVVISKGDYYSKYYYLGYVIHDAFPENPHNPIYSPIPNQV
mgnify:FL=1